MDEKLRQTVRFMRRNGLLKLKTQDFELELDPRALKSANREPLTAQEKLAEEQAQLKQFELQKLLDDPQAALFWSSPGLDLDDSVDGEPSG